MSRLTYSVAIKLLAEDFQKGVKKVQSGFSRMQTNIVTLAAAIGGLDVSLSGFASGVVQMTRETQRAGTMLKNVSATTTEYAESMRWAADLAKRYGVYVNDVVMSFAKFRGAAQNSNSTIEEQRDLFESVTRACSAFGLTADETNGAMNAITQMMSKGNIQAEELRGQLGERMPIAMQAMAKAANTTVGGLQKMMEQGQLTADILPAFGRALNEMLPNVQTDTLEAALGNLKNAAQEFTDELGLGDRMKSAVQGLTSAVQSAADNIGNIIVAVVALVVGAVGNGLVKMWRNIMTVAKGIETQAASTAKKLQAATAARVAAEQRLEQIRARMVQATSAQIVGLRRQEAAAINALNRAVTNEANAQSAARVAQARAEGIATTTAFGRVRSGLIVGAAKIRAAFTSMWRSFGPMIIISAIAGIIGKFVELRKEIEEINGRLEDFRKKVTEAGRGTPIEVEVRSYMEVAQSAGSSEAARMQAANIIAQKTGQQEQGANEAADAFVQRVVDGANAYFSNAALNAQREQASTSKAEQLTRLNEIRSQFGMSQLTGTEHFITLGEELDALRGAIAREGFSQSNSRRYREAEQATRIIIEADDILQRSVGQDRPIPETNADNNDVSTTGSGGGGGSKELSEVEKAEREYAQGLREIVAQYETGAITSAGKAKAEDELRLKTLQELMASEDATAARSEFAEELRRMPVAYTDEVRQLEALGGVYTQYMDAMREAQNQRDAGVVTEQQYWEAVRSAAQSALEQAAAIDPTTRALETYRDALGDASERLQEEAEPRPESKERDTTYDYKKSDRQILAEETRVAEANLKALEDYAEQLKESGRGVTDELSAAIDEQIEKTKELKDALALETIKEDIETYAKNGFGLFTLVDGIDGVVNAFERLHDVMNDDATAWDKIMAGVNIFRSMVQAVQSTMQAVKMFQTVLGAFNAFQRAQEVAGAATTASTSATKVAAKEAETTANTTAAASGVMAAHSGIPFVGIAIGAAMVATLLALLLSTKSKAKNFATGGIVEGSTATGDKVLAGLNAGEMVLNRRQQRRLWALLDGGGQTGGAANGRNVTARIRGEDLYVALGNYRKRTGKP